MMINIAIFTEEIANELMARGFELVARTKKAWFFEDSALLEVAVDELLRAFCG